MDVRDPSGRTWRVERRLIRLPRWRGFGRPSFDAADGVAASSGDGGLESLAIGLAVVILLVVSVAFVWPLLVLVAELVLAGVLLAGRFLLGRWTVVAETQGERRSWQVRGRGESRRFAAEVAESLRSGRALPTEHAFESLPTPPGQAPPHAPEQSGHVRVIRRDA